MTGCEHEWDDPRPMVAHAYMPQADQNIVACKKCGAPLQLARRTGLWKGTPDPTTGIEGPPFYYMGGPA